MSLFSAFKGFFTLKTSDQVAKTNSDTSQAKREDNLRHMNDIDNRVNQFENAYNNKITLLLNTKALVEALLGERFKCLLNEPVIHNAIITKFQDTIGLQWQSGSKRDEMTVMSVEYAFYGQYKLTCGTNCVGESTTSKASLVTDWMTYDDMLAKGLPGWFVDALETIKTANAARLNHEADLTGKFNLTNLVGHVIGGYSKSIERVKQIQEVIQYILHDEFNELSYYPNITQTRVSVSEISLMWKMPTSDIMLYVFNHDAEVVVVSFSEVTDGQSAQVRSKFESLDAAKDCQIPSFFKNYLQQIKDGRIKVSVK